MSAPLRHWHNFLALRSPLDQRHDPGCHGFHNVFGFSFVAVPIINVGDAALFVILDSVHCVATETQSGDSRAVRAPQIMWRCALEAKLATDRAHSTIEPVNRAAAGA